MKSKIIITLVVILLQIPIFGQNGIPSLYGEPNMENFAEHIGMEYRWIQAAAFYWNFNLVRIKNEDNNYETRLTAFFEKIPPGEREVLSWGRVSKYDKIRIWFEPGENCSKHQVIFIGYDFRDKNRMDYFRIWAEKNMELVKNETFEYGQRVTTYRDLNKDLQLELRDQVFGTLGTDDSYFVYIAYMHRIW